MAKTKRKIRVAHLIASLQIGGAENQVALILANLDPSRFSPHIITFKEIEGGFYNMLPDNVGIHCINYRQRNAPLSLYRLYRILKKQKIDVLHCHMYHAGVKGSMVARLASVPVTLTSEHGKNTWKNWLHHFIERNIVSRLTACRVAVSEDIRQIRINDDGVSAESVILIPNSVNTEVQVVDNAAIPKRLGAVGRLVDAKDYGVMLRAIKVIRDKGVDVTLQIAGEGDQRQHLQKIIDDLGLKKYAELIGNQNVNEFFSKIDLFVMSSKREGVPVALLEAMAFGMPIVATEAGGIPEVIKHEHSGLICPISDPSCLANNISVMIDNQCMRTRMGNNAREKVVNDFGVKSVVHQWETLYESLLDRSNGK